jgi:hypothetical protein
VTISHVDTCAQAGYIRQCLARLSITILTPEYNCNIQKINEYVVVLEEGLHARGESSQDTTMNINSAYMACKDANFVRHAKDKYGRWEQGATVALKGYMASCLVKYKTLKMKGPWEAPSPEQEQIIALTAAMSSLRTKPATKAGSKTKAAAPSKSTKKGDKAPSKTRNDGIFVWKDVAAPGPGEATSKVTNGKTYYWCTHHPTPMWALHNTDTYPNLCSLHPKYKELEAAHKEKGGAKELTADDIKINSALQAIEDSDDESGGSDVD